MVIVDQMVSWAPFVSVSAESLPECSVAFLCMHVAETIKREPDRSGVRTSAKPPFSRCVGIRQLLFSFILLSCELLGDDKCDKSVHFLPQ